MCITLFDWHVDFLYSLDFVESPSPTSYRTDLRMLEDEPHLIVPTDDDVEPIYSGFKAD